MDTIPILTQAAEDPSSLDDAIFKPVPVVAVLDPTPVQRGQPLRFRITMLDDVGAFYVNVRTEDASAIAGNDYEAVVGPRSFVTQGDVVVDTLDDGTLDAKEFAFIIDAITPMFIVRARAVGLILGIVDTGVYTLDVYEEEVYD